MEEQEENRKILQKIWEMRIEEPNWNDNSVRNIKDMFLVAVPPKGMDKDVWSQKLNDAWNDRSAFENFDKFWDFFKHAPSLKAVERAEGLTLQQVAELENPVTITQSNVKDIVKYTEGKRTFCCY